MSLAFFWKFQVFKREFLRNHLVYWAQISEIAEIVMLLRGGSRIFFRRGCTRLLLYFNTNKPHIFSFFCRIPVILENRRSSQGGGVRTLYTLPLDLPLLLQNSEFFLLASSVNDERMLMRQKNVNNDSSIAGHKFMLLYWIHHGDSTLWQGMKQDKCPNWHRPLHYPLSPWKVVPQNQALSPLLFMNSSVGSFMFHENQNSERAVRCLRFFILIWED